MGLDLIYNDGQTPLDEDEKEGLLIKSIATRGELDEFEQKNIEDAIQWSLTRRFKSEQILSETFILALHKRMYKNVWRWAGEYRKTNKNIGVDKLEIPVALRSLIDDASYLLENNVYEPDEFALRFKHRLVSIHCFPNGNGRHSRMIADIIIEKIYQLPVFSWGSKSLADENDSRKKYLIAIRKADKGNLDLLLKFARS
ncbi:MAG: mobile mystery protein B [Bacteroidota bacterium]|jgi:Fic-DOC domain mobile mystery protein B